MNDSTTLGQQIQKRRKAQKLSQQELADMARVSRNYISVIERGNANVSTAVLEGLAIALGVSLATLLGCSSGEGTLIPAALRQFGLEEGLSLEVIDKLVRIPKPEMQPDTVEGWRRLYEAIRPYVQRAGAGE